MIIDINSAVEGDFYSIDDEVSLNNSLFGSRVGDFTKPAKIKGWYTVVEEKVAVYLDLSTSAMFECDSCLNPAKVDFNLKISETFLKEKPVEETDADEEIDENYRIYDGDQIDLMPIINEQVVLAIPSKVLCKDDCKGMCNRCGQNFNEGDCKCDKNDREGDDNNPFAVLKKYKY